MTFVDVKHEDDACLTGLHEEDEGARVKEEEDVDAVGVAGFDALEHGLELVHGRRVGGGGVATSVGVVQDDGPARVVHGYGGGLYHGGGWGSECYQDGGLDCATW